MNNFNIKQKLYAHQARSGKIKTNKTQQILVTTQVFFVKSELQDILTTTPKH